MEITTIESKRYDADIIEYEVIRGERKKEKWRNQWESRKEARNSRVSYIDDNPQLFKDDYYKYKNDGSSIKSLMEIWGIRYRDVIYICSKHYGYVTSAIEDKLKAIRSEAEKAIVVNDRRKDFDEVYPAFGWSSKLGDKWEMSSQAASRYCRKHFDIGTEHVRLTKEQIEDCFSLKMSLRAIGRKYDLHADTVGDYCRKYGIEIPSPVYKVDWDSVDLESLLCDHSLSEIARQLDVTPAAVRRRAKKLELK